MTRKRRTFGPAFKAKVALDAVFVESKPIPEPVEVRRHVSDILKVRTSDGYWLFSRLNYSVQPGLPQGLGRLVQIGETTTFEVSLPTGVNTGPGTAGGEFRVKLAGDGDEQTIIVGYDSGALLRYDWPEGEGE
jgi:hypothetical protein